MQFSAAEVQQLRVGDVQVETHYCGCFDEPVKHYRYSGVIIRTTRGDLVTRPENVEVAVRVSPLAVRYGTDTAMLIQAVATARFLKSAISRASDMDLTWWNSSRRARQTSRNLRSRSTAVRCHPSKRPRFDISSCAFFIGSARLRDQLDDCPFPSVERPLSSGSCDGFGVGT